MSELFETPPTRTPVITLWQPWCSLAMEPDYKAHETRSFAYPARLEGQRIAFHAAAAFPAMRHISADLADLCYDAFGCAWNYSLPRGAILFTARLVGCFRTEDVQTSEEDRIAGDWTPGRFAWALTDREPLPMPLPAKGRQGWWSIETALLKDTTS